MLESSKERKSATDIARRRAAVRDLGPGVALLAVTQGSLVLADPDAAASRWHLAWALSPLLAIVMLVWGQYRVLHRCDERERLQQLTAMAVGFGVFAVLLATMGVMQAADIGDAVQQTQLTLVVGTVAWITALAVLEQRDR